MKGEIIEGEKALRRLAMKCNELSTNIPALPNGGCLILGSLCIVIIEAGWGLLSVDDQVRSLTKAEVDIHADVSIYP